MGASSSGGPYRSGNLTPPPKSQFSWLSFFGYILQIVGVIFVSIWILMFCKMVGDGVANHTDLQAIRAARVRSHCEDWCADHEYDYWESNSQFNSHREEIYYCACVQPSSHTEIDFICRLTNSAGTASTAIVEHLVCIVNN